MTTDRCLAALAMAIVALLGTSCANGEEPLSPPTANAAPSSMPELTQEVSAIPTPSPPAATSSEPTSEPIPTIAEIEATTEDEQAVIDTATELVEVIEPTILRDPDSDESLIDEWATGQARESAMSDINYTREQGERLVGEVRLTVLELEVEDDVATVRACLDPLGADYVDTGGESVLLANRYPSIVSMTLIRDVNTRFGWIVTENRAGGVACRE